MARKSEPGKTDRSQPQNNKSLAIRMTLKKMPAANAAELARAVKKDYGLDVSRNMVCMVKTKTNMASARKLTKQKYNRNGNPMTTPALWVDAIKTARQLLKSTGSVSNATALLKALDS